MSQLRRDNVEFCDDRMSGPYGSFVKPFHATNKETPELLKAIDGLIYDLGRCTIGVDAIATAGTWVDRSGTHGEGRAIDIDGIKFNGGETMVCNRDRHAPTDYYMTVDSCARRNFNIVLDAWYNSAHRDHFHCDMSTNCGKYRGTKSNTAYIQAALTYLGYDPGPIDKMVGPRTRSAFGGWYRHELGSSIPDLSVPFMAESLADWWVDKQASLEPDLIKFPSGVEIEAVEVEDPAYRTPYGNPAPLFAITDESREYKLSDHFKLKEFCCKNTSYKYVRVAPHLVETLEKIRAVVKKPIIVASGHRPEAYNQRIGGATDSLHIPGLAADIKVDGYTGYKLATICDRVIGAWGGVGSYPTWAHADVRGSYARWRE